MITVLLFAQLQDSIGKEQIEMEASNISISELKERLKSTYNLPQIDHVMISVNEEYALPGDMLSSGDVVALIPPVSGG
ncbi:MoaD/ThiS family protein [Paucisalibacillus globulus]|uniref:MoaD/ThiS family protein n=1 Tax=Paucisalibacillus globulus TaxID=351095 RepID=UPI0004011A69|nr:MoaD/ThiS family protein [Paucisalibacillus globulus]